MVGTKRHALHVLLLLGAAAIVVCCGCSRPLSTRQELEEFAVLNWRPEVDRSKIAEARVPSRPYELAPGDVITIQMVNVLQLAGGEEDFGDQGSEYRFRIPSSGTIDLPMIGAVEVAGKPLSEVEQSIKKAYHPQYVLTEPNIHAEVVEYSAASVSVIGAVQEPGIYDIRRDKLTLVSALMEAGGTTDEGAARIVIRRSFQDGEPPTHVGQGNEQKIDLPVKGKEVPFKDVQLQPRDVVEVQRRVPQYFTVSGLVNNPGVYPYPPGEEYTLKMAIAFAGGRAENAPNKASIHRKAPEGETKTVTVSLEPKESDKVIVKPGDVVSVDHTFTSGLASFFTNFVQSGFFMGANYNVAQ